MYTIGLEFKTFIEYSLGAGISKAKMAKEFEVAESTVERWKNGVAIPHKIIQNKVKEWIGKEFEGMKW